MERFINLKVNIDTSLGDVEVIEDGEIRKEYTLNEALIAIRALISFANDLAMRCHAQPSHPWSRKEDEK